MTGKKKKPSGKAPYSLHNLGHSVLGERPARIFPYSKKIRRHLLQANVKINHVVYISSMFFWSILAGVLIIPIMYFLLTFFLPVLFIPPFPVAYSITLSVLAGLLGFGVSFAVFLYYPNYKASIVRGKIERNLVYTSNYMAILASAGATPGETFNSLARSGDVFNLRESARSIAKNVELLGEDLISALSEESKITPSKLYSNFLQGYIATIQTGGNLYPYLMIATAKFSDIRRRLLAKMIDQLGLAGELYITMLVAFPIIMVTLISVMGALGGEVIGGLSAAQLLPLMVYILVPFAAMIVLIFIDAIISSW